MIRISSLPRQVWNACNYDEMKLLALVLGDKIAADGEGMLVDVGAHFGSSCLPFLEKGWNVLALEPDASNRKRLELVRERFPTRLNVIPKAASDREEVVPFYSSETSTGISSLHSFHESHEEFDQVQTVPLRTLLRDQQVESVGLLKIDVEGHEMAVLRSMDWAIHPRVVVCEFDETKQLDNGPTAEAIRSFLQNVGYLNISISEWYPVVEYGQHHRPRRLTETNDSTESNAWGNVIAFSSPADQAEFEARARPLLARARTFQPITKRVFDVRHSTRLFAAN